MISITLLPEITMPKPKRMDRVITEDCYGCYCIDTYEGFEQWPLMGYGMNEDEAVADVERQARLVWGE